MWVVPYAFVVLAPRPLRYLIGIPFGRDGRRDRQTMGSNAGAPDFVLGVRQVEPRDGESEVHLAVARGDGYLPGWLDRILPSRIGI